jgi:hypothetical protein
MRQYTLDHLSDAALLRQLSELMARDRATTADLLAHIAEVDYRRLYAGAGYPSMFAYCVEALHLSEDAAGKRIQAARAARKYPALLAAVDQGKIHLSGVCLLAPHLTESNVEQMIDTATHKGRREIEAWLVAQSLTPAVPMKPCVIRPVVVARESNDKEDAVATLPFELGSASEHAPGHTQVSPDLSPQPDPRQVDESGRTAPAAPEYYRMQLIILRRTHDKLRYAQDLLSHAVAPGDVAQVLDRALDLLIRRLESRRFGIPGRRHAPERH